MKNQLFLLLTTLALLLCSCEDQYDFDVLPDTKSGLDMQEVISSTKVEITEEGSSRGKRAWTQGVIFVKVNLNRDIAYRVVFTDPHNLDIQANMLNWGTITLYQTKDLHSPSVGPVEVVWEGSKSGGYIGRDSSFLNNNKFTEKGVFLYWDNPNTNKKENQKLRYFLRFY